MNEEKLFEIMADIDDKYVAEAHKDPGKSRRHSWIGWAAAAACLCLAAAVVILAIPKTVPDKAAGTEAGGKAPVAVGPGADVMYSVAVMPAGRDSGEMLDAYCREISQEEALNEAGLGDYLPAELPEGYRFGIASIYVTTMNDGAVYRMLKVTYYTGQTAEVNEGGYAQNPDAQRHEFRISLCDFRPDTTKGIYTPDEIRAELAKGNTENGMFYVLYDDCYAGFEPLSLGTEETLKLIESIGR